MKRQNIFFEKVYEVVRKIPEGKVMTYGQIALRLPLRLRSGQGSGQTGDKINISPRIVGWALHANQNLDIPCHRVVSKDGGVALNYSMGDWKEQKRKLLSEGVKFKDEMRVDLKKFLWNP